MVITPGGRVGDDSHFSNSKTSNWVARAGGLPKYILEVAHALIKDGHDESSAIAIAVATMKRWAAGRGNVTPKVQAAAAAALAEWEAKRGASHVKKVKMSNAEFNDITKSLLGMTDSEIAKYDPKQPRDPHSGEWVKVGAKMVRRVGNGMYHNSKGQLTHTHNGETGKPISIADAAERMYGTNSPQHIKAKKMFADRMKNAPTAPKQIQTKRAASTPIKAKDGSGRVIGHGHKMTSREKAARGIKKSELEVVTRVMTDREYDQIVKNFGEFEDDDFTITGEIIEKNLDKQLVFGWASVGIRKDGTILTDRQGDIIDSPDEIEKSAYDFVLSSRDGGEMHVRKGVSTLVESFVSTIEKTRAMGIPDGILPIGWWTGWKVHDPEVWDAVKKGKYPMFSVHGRGIRTEYVEGD